LNRPQSIPYKYALIDVTGRYRTIVPNEREEFDPIALVQGHWLRGELDLCKGELYQLQLFVKDLNDVRNARSDVFELLKAKVYQCRTADNYFGLRMEAKMAAELVKTKLPFDYRDRPDFSVQGGTVNIACSSVWPDISDPVRDYRNRIASKIEKKGRLGYAKPNTLLAIDSTIVTAAMANHGLLDEKTDLNQFLANVIDRMAYGAVLSYNTVYSGATGMLMSVYSRFDSPRMDAALLIFLDTYFPLGDLTVYEPFVPGQSGGT